MLCMLTLEFMGWTVAKLVILAITLFAVWKGLSGIIAPDLNNAVLTAEIIRGSINDICNGQTTTLEGIRLTQPKPSKFYGFSTILPRYQIQSSGDPNYLLYYESFPAGEAVGWDIYTGLQYRIITPFDYKKFSSGKLQAPGDTIKNPADIENFVKALRQHVAIVGEEFKTKAEENDLQITTADVFVTNIVLSDSLNVFPDQDPEKPALGKEGQGNLGKWEIEEVADEPGKPGNKNKINNRFKFTNIVIEQNSLERSLIKYRPCGDNAICLKTRDTVYKFPLSSSCKDIRRIELVYDLTAQDDAINDIFEATLGVSVTAGSYKSVEGVSKRVATSTGIKKTLLRALKGIPLLGLIFTGFEALDVPDALISLTLTYKSSDFYLASPCKIPGTIEVEKFTCGSGEDPADVCKREISYPIYSYSSDGDTHVVTYEGDHYKCVENIGNDLATVKDDSLTPNAGDCIRIKVTEERPKDYCWTVEPYKEWEWWGHNTVQTAAAALSLHPVKFNTGFLKDSSSIVLYPSGKGEEGFLSSLKALEERWGWGWPGQVTD